MNRLLLAPLMLVVSCGQGGNPDIRTSEGWARATAPGQTSAAAYITISNKGSRDDRLIGVTAPPPAMAMLHETSSSAGVSSMHAMESGADIPSGGTLKLKPLGMHIMITGLDRPLKPETDFPLTLRFKRSGERRVAVRVIDASATGPQ